VQNTASASVTIREFGLFVAGAGGAVMIYRATLDTPVTIAQYETATISFTVSMTIEDPV